VSAARSAATGEFNRKLLSQAAVPARDSDLPLGPGDLLEVSVFDVPEFSGLKLRVPLGGSVTLPLIGDVAAGGLTPTELQSVIRARLQQDYMHDPQVSVFVTEQKSQRISVWGAVRSGGVFTLTSRLRLADALAMAGGLADDAGRTLYVIRHVSLENGAARPGASPVQLAAVATPEKTDASPQAANTQEIMTTVDLEALAEGKEELNLTLQPGDVVNIPRAGSYFVGGQVQRSGSFLLKGARTTVTQAVVAAGGAKDTADWDDVRIYRKGAGGEAEIITFSLNDAEQGKSAPEIQPDDTIVVGRSAIKTVLYGIKDFIRVGVGASVPLAQ
jgi:polysaccharide export outer membrane protein